MSFDPIAYINEPRWMESRLGLERISELLERIGKPQDALRFVHVAGTNGKGSVCAFLAQILQESGYTTGLFTSPYIIEFADRIRVNEDNISPDELFETTLIVKEAADLMADHPTEFELMTAVAFLHFARKECDIVVCEVGLGGRLDSTNVIETVELCIINAIGLDHTEMLGDTLGAIAGEKAGIIKKGVPVLSWEQKPEAMDIIEKAAREQGAPLSVPVFSQLDIKDYHSFRHCEERSDEAIQENPCNNKQGFTYQGETFQISLLGTHQPFNAVMAIEAVKLLRQKGWNISNDALHRGLASTSWSGRFEIIAQNPTFVVDGAHNVDGVQVLVDSLKTYFPQVSPVFIVGVLGDKDYQNMLKLVVPVAAAFVTIAPLNPRAVSANDLAASICEIIEYQGYSLQDIPVHRASGISEAIKHARKLAGTNGLVCAFGSLYSVASIKQSLN